MFKVDAGLALASESNCAAALSLVTSNVPLIDNLSLMFYPEIGRQKGKMDWRERIHSDTEILLGKPVIKGTRLSVDFILDLLAAGWTEQQILENYPTLTSEDLQAIFAFAAECMKGEALYTLPSKAG